MNDPLRNLIHSDVQIAALEHYKLVNTTYKYSKVPILCLGLINITAHIFPPKLFSPNKQNISPTFFSPYKFQKISLLCSAYDRISMYNMNLRVSCLAQQSIRADRKWQ